jgi:hypothetical protein
MVDHAWEVIMTAAVGLIWLIRLEGRVNQGDVEQKSTEKDLDETKREIREDLRYIRERLDGLVADHNGRGRGR